MSKFYILLASLLGALAVSTGSAAAQSVEAIAPCLPDGYDDLQVVAAVPSGDAHYAFAGFYLNGQYFTTAIVVESGDCQILVPHTDPLMPLDAVMPFDVARQLYLINYQDAIANLGSLAALQERFEINPSEQRAYYSEAKLAALSEVGITVPPHYTLRSSDPEVDAVMRRFSVDLRRHQHMNTVAIAEGYAIANWHLGDWGGKIVGQLVDGEWQTLGHTETLNVTAQSLHLEFGIPARIAQQLLDRQAEQ